MHCLEERLKPDDIAEDHPIVDAAIVVVRKQSIVPIVFHSKQGLS